MKLPLAALLLLVLSGSASAQEKYNWKGDGNSLLAFCSVEIRAFEGENLNGGEAVEGGQCVGYVMGIGDLMTTIEHVQKRQNVTLFQPLCVPDSASTGQIVRVVVKFLKDNPEKLHMPADVLTIGALRNAFPCK